MLKSFLQLLKWYIQQSKASDTAHSCKHQCSGTWRSWRSFLTGCWCLTFALAVLMSYFCSADVRCLQCWWLIFAELMSDFCSVDVRCLQCWCLIFAELMTSIYSADVCSVDVWCLQCWCLIFAVLVTDICSVDDMNLQCWCLMFAVLMFAVLVIDIAMLMSDVFSVDVWCLQCPFLELQLQSEEEGRQLMQRTTLGRSETFK